MILALAVAVVAFAIRVLVSQFMPVIQPDGVVYVAVAKQFQATGSPFDPLFHPLYPMFIARAQPFVGDWETSGRLVSAFFGALMILPAFALARGIVGRQAALLSAVFIAVHPRLVQNSAGVLCEATYTFFLVSGVLAARRGLVSGPRALIAFGGLCFGLSYLVRPEGTLYLVGLVLVAIFMIVTRRERAAAILPWVGGAVLVFVVVVAPYIWYLAEVWGHVTLSGKIDHNLLLATGAATAPGPLPMRVLENVLLFQKYAVPDLLPWILLLLVLPGVLARGRTPGWLGRDATLLAAALPPFASLAFHVEPRIFLPILPFILPFAAVGTLWAAVTLTDARRGWRWSLAMALVVALILVPWTFQPVLRPDAGAALYRQAARWIAETQPRDAVLLDRKPLVAFYSERRWVPLPRIGPDELLAAARHAGARLVVLDSREFLFDRPGLIPLLWGPPPPGLDVLRDFDAAPADRLRILVVNERG
ncbi:MAG: ArnT family glycosyltransferase [Candidatus Rokuibacteriota bacterium]